MVPVSVTIAPWPGQVLTVSVETGKVVNGLPGLPPIATLAFNVFLR